MFLAPVILILYLSESLPCISIPIPGGFVLGVFFNGFSILLDLLIILLYLSLTKSISFADCSCVILNILAISSIKSFSLN